MTPPIMRIELPASCPRCGGAQGSPAWYWAPYRFIPGAPAAGCSLCGYIVYLRESLTPLTLPESDKPTRRRRRRKS